MVKMRRTAWLAVVTALVALLTGCLRFNVEYLSSDALAGRNNNSPGGVAAHDYIIDILGLLAVGAVPGQSGDAAYQQPFPQGVNVLGKITGTSRPDEHVIIGAHYDHHASCGNSGGDIVCNGATDNATGVAMVLDMATRFAADPPERTVVFAFWDAEEDGLLGSQHYVSNPVIPLADTVAYLNLDIQGANLLPTLRNHTFAIGAASGGDALQAVVDAAYDGSSLDGVQLSAVFGLYRSDYAPFLGKNVPTVFFTDSTGPCYHTPDDEVEIVDFDKLAAQTDIVHHTATALANEGPGAPGSFLTPVWETSPTVVFDDVVHLLGVIETSLPDWHRFPQNLSDSALAQRDVLAQIVADGPGAFDDADVGPVLNAAVVAVDLLTYGDCDGFLE